MSSTITGNVGGSSFSGALVQATHVANKKVTFTLADASGNYSLTLSVAGAHNISVTYPAYVYYRTHQVIVDNSSNYSDINFAPTALNASNNPPANNI
jgi:hypothetical protein